MFESLKKKVFLIVFYAKIRRNAQKRKSYPNEDPKAKKFLHDFSKKIKK